MTAAESINFRKQKFQRAFHFVIMSEGGTNFDPIDRGGLTRWGISEKQYPKLDIDSLTLEEAKQIYLTDYWLKNKCDLMAPDLGLILFDCSVNCGQPSAAKWLQRGCNKLGSKLKDDGVIGRYTMDEVYKYSSFKLQSLVISERLRRYTWLIKNHPDQLKYIRGWIDRVANLIEFSTISKVQMFK